MEIKLRRWAERTGCTVKWGNIIGSYVGQEFCEVFKTEADAITRERQALACEPIGKDREPVAVSWGRL